MNWGVVTTLTLAFVFCLSAPGWAGDTANISLVDLSDRDAIILTVDGEALVSDLVVHKLKPNRLEAYYEYEGDLPTAVESAGDLITDAVISGKDDGFLLTLSLSDSITASGQAVYRETILGGGQTAIEVFADNSQRSPFQVAWIGGNAGNSVPVRTESSPAPAVPAAAPSAAVTTTAGFTGASFDQSRNTLILKGVDETDCEISEQTFPPRVDVFIPGAAFTPQTSGLVFKDYNNTAVTYVEVIESKSGAGVVVRANLAPDVTLVKRDAGSGGFELGFGNAPAGSAPKLNKTPVPAMSSPQPVPAAKAPEATPVKPLGSPVQPVNTSQPLSTSLSSAAGSMLDVPTPTGFRGVPQEVASIEQILTKSREDAKRYARAASDREDNYGDYELPGFADAEEQLSDVRINLNAAGGFSLYSFLIFLSQISGISILIDPYWVDEPFGTTRRDPPDPGFIPGEGGGGAGFRQAGIFDPSLGGSGSVMGNFDNVPFDQALDIVLNTHNLKKVVYRNEGDPYAQPIILITSKERLEQEIEGQNEIDLYQLHYADPTQIYEILNMLNLLPSVQYGWYYYQGGGNSGGQGGGGGGFGGGGGGNGGFGGGGGGFSASPSLDAGFASSGQMSSNYFGSPLAVEGDIQPMQGGGIGGGGGGGIGGGGGGGGIGGGGGGFGGGGGGQGGQFGQLWTAKAGMVVMRGTRGTLNTIQALIAKIDKPPKQVALKVKLYTTSDNPQEIYGLIAATAQNDRLDVDYNTGAISFNVLPKGGVLLDENYSAAFSFLQSESKARLVTETEVAVIDGFPATITTSRTRGQLDYQAQVNTGTQGGVVYTPTWTPITAGTTLTFTPQIDDRGRITMNVNIQISFFDGAAQRAAAPDGGEVIFQPTGNTTINTFFRMVDGQAALLGGLTNSEDSETFSGIPFISKLPFIGKYFGRTEKIKSSDHFFVVIQANIIDDK